MNLKQPMHVVLINLFAKYFASTASDAVQENNIRLHTLIASVLAAPIYVLFAMTNLYIYEAVWMATVTSIAACTALLALILLNRYRDSNIAGHCFTTALAIQVFGEMALNGGLQAPASALSLLVVPAAILTAGAGSVLLWSAVTITAISVIAIMDFNAVLPGNELPLAAQQFDRLFSLSAGIIIAAVMVHVFHTQVKRSIEKLRVERANFKHSALHDPLTDLPNRRFFNEQTQKSIEYASEHGTQLILYYLDIDRFKQINDQHGHATGDELLIIFAERLRRQMGHGDFAARLAGDEFALLEHHDSHSNWFTVDKLRAIGNSPFNINGIGHDAPLSIGFAMYPGDGSTLDELLHVADQRMYEDKSTRRRLSQESDGSSNVISLSSLRNARRA